MANSISRQKQQDQTWRFLDEATAWAIKLLSPGRTRCHPLTEICSRDEFYMGLLIIMFITAAGTRS